MTNILVFGTGSGCQKMLLQLDMNKINILAFVDNDLNKQSSIFCNRKIISVMNIGEYTFDYIIISSEYYKEIMIQLKETGISKDKILSWYYYNNDSELNSEYNNKILNEISIITSNYFLEFKDKIIANLKKNTNDNLLLNRKVFKSFDKEYYNKNYSKAEAVLRDCTPSISYCEKIIDILLNKYKLKIKNSNESLKVLDIGCGEGYFLEAIRRKGFSVHGIDYSEVAIENASNKFKQCKFSVMDATNPRFNEEKFDVLFMRGLSIVINTHNLELIKEIVDKYFDFLNDGGIFILSASTNFTGIESDSETVNLTIEEIRRLSEIIKFQFVDILYPEEEIIRIKKFNEKVFYYLILKK